MRDVHIYACTVSICQKYLYLTKLQNAEKNNNIHHSMTKSKPTCSLHTQNIVGYKRSMKRRWLFLLIMENNNAAIIDLDNTIWEVSKNNCVQGQKSSKDIYCFPYDFARFPRIIPFFCLNMGEIKIAKAVFLSENCWFCIMFWKNVIHVD